MFFTDGTQVPGAIVRADDVEPLTYHVQPLVPS
jgi:hypothetical protein